MSLQDLIDTINEDPSQVREALELIKRQLPAYPAATDAEDGDFIPVTKSGGLTERLPLPILDRRGVTPLPDITALYSLNTDALVGGQQFNVGSYLPDTSTGSCLIRWRPDLPKSRHDGVLFFSPTVPMFTGTDTTDYRAGTGETDASGNGVFELVRGEIIYDATVLVPTHFADWQEAFSLLSKFSAGEGATGVIHLQGDAQLTESLVIRSGDYSWMTIRSDAEITITQWSGGESLVDVRRATMPFWDASINCDKKVNYGLDLRNCSTGNGASGKGVRRCFGPAIRVSASRFEAPGGRFTESGTVGEAAYIHNAQVTQNGNLSGDGMDLSGATGENSLYLSRNAEYHGANTDFSGSERNAVHCRRSSRFNANNSIFDNIAGLAAICRHASTGAMQESTGTGMMGGCIDVLDGILHADGCSFEAAPGNTAVAVTQRGGHLGINNCSFGQNFGALIESRGAGMMEARSVACTGTTDAFGVQGWDGATIAMAACNLTGLAGIGVQSTRGSHIIVRGGTVSGSSSGTDLNANNGSTIVAIGTTTTNGAGSPDAGDTSHSTFNAIVGNLGIIWA